ncbi:MAG: hypothetical protein ACNA7K_02465 [Acholeplasmataceae bacterium]
MIKEAFLMQKQKKSIIQGLLFFSVFMLIFTMVDGLNMSYPLMAETYGTYLVILNITLNIIMSLASALLMNLSTAMVILKGTEGKSTNFGFFSVLFGILTYGCTSCVIAFFAVIGIGFSVVALPLAGLPYKLISLILIGLGLAFMFYELKHGKCKVNLKEA